VKKKVLLVTIIFFLIGAIATSTAPPVYLQLNTIIDATSSFTVNQATATADIILGESKSIPYTYEGNFPVTLTILSAFNFNLRHSDYGNTNSWIIPYNMTMDYGNGTQVPVPNNTAMDLIDTDGTYDLASNMIITLTPGNYPAGSYTDTLTFTITAR
jgi:hypothetical protein